MGKGQGEEEATGEDTSLAEHRRNIEQRRISLLGMQEWEHVPSFSVSWETTHYKNFLMWCVQLMFVILSSSVRIQSFPTSPDHR